MSARSSQHNLEEDDTEQRIIDLLESRNAKPLEMAKDEVLREEFRNANLQRVTVLKILRYFSKRWINKEEPYALGPAIMALSCEAVGGDPETTIPVAASVILIGSGAELHDDIIDKSKTKNSRPTIVGKFGSSAALIAGDMLLTKGFALLHGKSCGLPTLKTTASIVDIIKKAIFEHADAEFLALELKGRSDIPPEKYMQVIRMRSSIVEAQARIGAIMGGGASTEIEALGKYGRLLGTLSLIRGEFVDMFEIEELDHRIKYECLPLPILVTLQDSRRNSRAVIEILKQRRMTERDRTILVQRTLGSEGLEALRKQMCDMAQAADLSIAALRPKPVSSLRLLTKATLMGI